jgi:hypothetical protein
MIPAVLPPKFKNPPRKPDRAREPRIEGMPSDRAILSTLLFHALRREELCKLKVKDFRHARMPYARPPPPTP